MLIFRNAILEYCLIPQGSTVKAAHISADGGCECWVEEGAKNIRSPYPDGHVTTANVTITINQSAVTSDFSPAFIRYKLNRSASFTEWLPVKNVEWLDLVKSINIVCQ